MPTLALPPEMPSTDQVTAMLQSNSFVVAKVTTARAGLITKVPGPGGGVGGGGVVTGGGGVVDEGSGAAGAAGEIVGALAVRTVPPHPNATIASKMRANAASSSQT